MREAGLCLYLQGVPRDVLQLISVACVLIAAKHEEVRLMRPLIHPY